MSGGAFIEDPRPVLRPNRSDPMLLAAPERDHRSHESRDEAKQDADGEQQLRAGPGGGLREDRGLDHAGGHPDLAGLGESRHEPLVEQLAAPGVGDLADTVELGKQQGLFPPVVSIAVIRWRSTS